MANLKPFANKQAEIISLLDTVTENSSQGYTKISVTPRKGHSAPSGNIFLPLPMDLNIQTAYDWTVENTGSIANEIFTNGLSGKGAGELAEFFAQRGGNFIANQVSANAGAMFMQSRGVALNPQEKVFFKSSRHRTFDYQWSIAPFTLDQANKFWSSVNILHQNASPDFAGSEGFLFVVPSVFDLSICTKQANGVQSLIQATCAITNIGTNLTPDGFWSSFKDGTPTRITLSINFTEMSVPIAMTVNANPFQKGNTGTKAINPSAATQIGDATGDIIPPNVGTPPIVPTGE